MKIRSETIAMLRYIDKQGIPVTVSEVSNHLERCNQSVRNQFNRYVDAGLLKLERRYDRTGRVGRPTLDYFMLTIRAKDLLAKHPHIKAWAPPTRPVVNSVFALGSNVLCANPT